jgi:hypothetical protein
MTDTNRVSSLYGEELLWSAFAGGQFLNFSLVLFEMMAWCFWLTPLPLSGIGSRSFP